MESQPGGKSPELKSKVVATEAVGIYSKSKLTSVPLPVAGERVASGISGPGRSIIINLNVKF